MCREEIYLVRRRLKLKLSPHRACFSSCVHIILHSNAYIGFLGAVA
jgi:hypothetical protein